MINELNEEQIKLMEVVKQEWIDRLDSCPHPNHEAIISGVRWLYSFCKLKDPLVVIVQSPLGAQIAANMLCADQVSAQVHAQVSAQVSDQVHAQVYAQVSAQVHDQVQYFCFSTYGNIWDFGWLSFYDFFARIGIKHKVKAFAAFRTLMQSGLYDMIQLDGACIVSEMPTEIHRDNRGRLHNVEGPAIKFGDGYEMYSLFGVRLDKEIHAKICSGSMCIKDIFAIENIEQRMVALKMRGAEKILEESKAQLLDSSARGNQLYILKEVFSVPAYFLKYKDPSTDRVYVSGIDPEIGIDANADKAMAWKFNLNAEEYSQLLTINEA